MNSKYYSKKHAQAERAWSLRKKNLSIEYIAKTLGITGGTVQHYISLAKRIEPVKCEKCGGDVLYLNRFKGKNMCTECMIKYDSMDGAEVTLEYQMAQAREGNFLYTASGIFMMCGECHWYNWTLCRCIVFNIILELDTNSSDCSLFQKNEILDHI